MKTRIPGACDQPHRILSHDDEHHRLGIANVAGLPTAPRGVVGVDHSAFTFADIDALFAKYFELEVVGAHSVWTVDHGTTISAHYADPDGNGSNSRAELCDLARLS